MGKDKWYESGMNNNVETLVHHQEDMYVLKDRLDLELIDIAAFLLTTRH